MSLEHFGASADYRTLYREFGLTADAVAAAAHDSIADVAGGLDVIRPGGIQKTAAPAEGGTGDQLR